MTYDSPFAALGNVRDTAEVETQVGAIVRSFAPGHDLTRIGATFELLNRAFDGNLPGYQKLNFYEESIDLNLDYLDRVVKTEREHRVERLKRGGVVEEILELKGPL